MELESRFNYMERRLEIDNRSLVEECLKGDKEALNLFYLRFAPRMLNLIRRYVREDNDVEDILHDGFIVAFTRLKTLRDPEKVDYWLASIMKNLSIRFLQEQDVAQLLHEEKDMEDTGAVDNIIDMEVLETLIKKLPPGYQKVFRLSILENKSHKEIAKILGIAPNSSSSQLFHAKVMMRQLITEYKKQAGIWCLLLIGLTAGVAFLIPVLTKRDELKLVAQAPQSVTGVEPMTLSDNVLSDVADPSGNMPVGSSYRADGDERSDKSEISEHEDLSGLAADMDNNQSIENNQDISNNQIAEIIDIPSVSEREEKDNSVNHEENTADICRDAHIVPGLDLAPKKTFRSNWSLLAKADAGFISHSTHLNRNGDFSNDSFMSPGDINDDDKNTDGGVDKTRVGDSSLSMNLPQSLQIMPRSGSRDFSYYSGMKHKNDFPVSFSLAVSRALNERIGIEAGLSYTYLSSTFERSKVSSHCRWHYLGVPLRVTFRSFATGRLKFYGAVGGSFEIPVYSYAHVDGDKSDSFFAEGRFSSPVVWTISGVYGASFKLSEKFELFVEPTVQVYLHNKATVPNLWSDNRVGFSLPIGLRFNW